MSVKKLKEFAKSVNIASKFSDEKLREIGDKVKLGFEEDYTSMSEWLEDVKKIEQLASLTSKKKSTPLPNSANVKLPIITKACQEYASTAYPEIVKDDKIVQAYVLGKDFDGSKAKAAKKCTDYMNYQLLFEQQNWELELDKLLYLLAQIGFICKKTYYDPVDNLVKSEICDYKELIINCDVKNLDSASRISQILHLTLNDFIEKSNTKVDDVSVYLEEPVEQLHELHKLDQVEKPIDIIEQHCRLDLDEDGYAEPYIVTILRDDNKVLRICSRYVEAGIKSDGDKVVKVTPVKYFVDYHFLVSPKGKFQSVGFGLLLLHLTDSSNSIINQLLDSGQLANMRGGYRDARCKIIPSGNSLHDPAEWKEAKVQTGGNLKDAFVPIDYKEPSSVLYQLLGLLIDVSRDLTSSAEINNGTQSSENAKTGATLALQQEGKKTINAINKRVYRSLTNEFRQIFNLNGYYLDKSISVNSVGQILEVSQEDFDSEKLVMYPVADPTLSSEQKKIGAAQFAQSLIQNPGIDPEKVTKYIIANSPYSDMDQLLIDPNKETPPNPEVVKTQADIQHMSDQVKIENRKLDIEQQKAQAEVYKVQCQCLELKAKAMLEIAQAEAQKEGTQMESYHKELDMLMQQMDQKQQELQLMHDYTSQQSAQAHEKEIMGAEQAHEQQMSAQQAPPAGATE